MKVLAISDKESDYLWNNFRKEKLDGIELILSAGDLKPEYLSFLATMTAIPILYIHGNHDSIYAERSPDGCVCVEDSIYVYKGIRILGLGGSICYNNGNHQYTEEQMQWRIRRLTPTIKRFKGFDILLTHSPAYGLNDGKDLAHTGFKCFPDLLKKYHPRYFVHGHYHKTYSRDFKQIDMFDDICIINAYKGCAFDIDER